MREVLSSNRRRGTQFVVCATQSETMEPPSEKDEEERAQCSQFDRLPVETMRKIFCSLPEKDLVRASGTSKRLFSIADKVGNVEYWKKVYQDVFEYRTPLYHPAPAIFEFRDVAQWEVENPWKESYKQLRRGVHVWPDYNGERRGRNLTRFDTLKEAIAFLKTHKEKEPLVFLHSGHYVVKEGIIIDTNLQIIGAAPEPNVAEQVTIETLFWFIGGAQNSYLGNLTVKHSIKYSGFSDNTVLVTDDASPVIDRCNIQNSCLSTHDGAGLVVIGEASPKVRNCTFSDSDVGIEILDEAEGVYQECEIAGNRWTGVCVKSTAKPVLRNCQIHHGFFGGVIVVNGEGRFENCKIHDNQGTGITVRRNGNPTVTKCDIHHNQGGVLLVMGRGHFSENQIHHNIETGIEIRGGDPTIEKNEIHDQRIGVDILKGTGLIEDNSIHGNTLAGIGIAKDSYPTLQNNGMHTNGEDIKEEADDYSSGQVEDSDSEEDISNEEDINEEADDSDSEEDTNEDYSAEDIIDGQVEDSDSGEDSVNGQEEED